MLINNKYMPLNVIVLIDILNKLYKQNKILYGKRLFIM